MFTRTIENTIKDKFNSKKAIIVVGARQVGKTTLLKEVLTGKEFLFLDADDPSTRSLFQNPTTEQIRTFLGDYKYVFSLSKKTHHFLAYRYLVLFFPLPFDVLGTVFIRGHQKNEII
ncbi:MAG: AAA family ATPase, partial [Draconibacterium sp.]